MLTLGLTIGAPLALQAAEVASTTRSVTATVLDSCILTAPAGLVFASVNTGVVTNQTVQGSVSVICTAAKPSVTVKLEGGGNAAAGQCNMKSVANDLLPYNVTAISAPANRLPPIATAVACAASEVTLNY